MLRIFSNRKRVKLFSVLKNMPQFRENRFMNLTRIAWNGYRLDMKIFSILKILAEAIIVKTSRGTQKQTARNKRTGAITKTKKIQITGGIYND